VAILPGNPTLAFYANASAKIGAGHVMRLIAIAQAAKVNYRILFYYRFCDSVILDKIKQCGFITQKLNKDLSFSQIESAQPIAIFIDDYQLNANDRIQLSALNCYKALLDDNLEHDIKYADLVINPAPNAKLDEYKIRAPNAVFCLGPQYTLLREEFTHVQPAGILQRPKVLITLGGTDIKSLALPLCKCVLAALPTVDILLLLADRQHPNISELEQLARTNATFNIVINPPSVARIMADAGFSISAAGGTLGELASLGVPTLAMIVADNQVGALTSPLNNTWYQTVDLRSYTLGAITQENHTLLTGIKSICQNIWYDKCRRKKMSDFASQLIDSQGCRRIIDVLSLSLQKMDEK